MFTSNPFSELSASIPTMAMQAYIILMILMVISLTASFQRKPACRCFLRMIPKKAKKSAKRTVSTGEKASIAVQVLVNTSLTSTKFCNVKRRLSHLLTMYGFILFVATTAIMIFAYPTPATPTPAILPLLWHIGALMLAIGGYWFWFFIRVDVSAEGLSWYRFERTDLFIVSLLTTATFGLIWSYTQSQGIAGWSTLAFVLFIASSTALFGSVFWSKFAHMFFKPAAAFQKRVTRADGSRQKKR